LHLDLKSLGKCLGVDRDSLSLSGMDRSYLTISVLEKQNQLACYDKQGPPIDMILTQMQLQEEVDTNGTQDQQGWKSPPRKHTAIPSLMRKRESEVTPSPPEATNDNYYSSLGPQLPNLTSLGRMRNSPLWKKSRSVIPLGVTEVTMQDPGSPQSGSGDADSEGNWQMETAEEDEHEDETDLADVGLSDNDL